MTDDQSADDEDRSQATDDSSDSAEDMEIPAGSSMEDLESIIDRVRAVTDTILGQPLDTVTAVQHNEDGWVVTVQVVERESVPDTQDILGQYEIRLDDSASPVGYERTRRYRRDQMSEAL